MNRCCDPTESGNDAYEDTTIVHRHHMNVRKYNRKNKRKATVKTKDNRKQAPSSQAITTKHNYVLLLTNKYTSNTTSYAVILQRQLSLASELTQYLECVGWSDELVTVSISLRLNSVLRVIIIRDYTSRSVSATTEGVCSWWID